MVTADFHSHVTTDMHDVAADMLDNALRRQAV
jgi:hypothetical protein